MNIITHFAQVSDNRIQCDTFFKHLNVNNFETSEYI